MKKICYSLMALLLAICWVGSVFAEMTSSIPDKFQRGYSQKDLYQYLVERETHHRISLTHFLSGKTGYTNLIESDQHGRMKLKAAFVQLVEIADTPSSDLTVRLYTAGDFLTDLVTFTTPVDVTGAITQFALRSPNQILEETQGLGVTIGGTTSTLGEIVIHTEWVGAQE